MYLNEKKTQNSNTVLHVEKQKKMNENISEENHEVNQREVQKNYDDRLQL